MQFNVRRAVLGDEPVLRALRLEALAESPQAFGSTYERELARTPEDWRRWLAPGATFILESADEQCGLVAGVRDQADASVVHLMAMWVRPKMRGTNAANLLIAAVMAWAGEVGAKEARLNVFASNARARRCYERAGFKPTGREIASERNGETEIEMSCECADGNDEWKTSSKARSRILDPRK